MAWCKLTPEQVLEARRLVREEGWTRWRCAIHFRVALETMVIAINGRTWKHLPGAVKGKVAKGESATDRKRRQSRQSNQAIRDQKMEGARRIREDFMNGGWPHDLAAKYEVSRVVLRLILGNVTYHDPAYNPVLATKRNLAAIRGESADEGNAECDQRPAGLRGRKPRYSMNQVRSMRDRFASGEATQVELRVEYKMSPTMISLILQNERYVDPKYKPPAMMERRLMKNEAIRRACAARP
jgi:hypothetical protein